jgi:hypothetical protein
MFSLICERKLQKINLYTYTYTNITHTHIYIHVVLYIERGNMLHIWGGGREKENERA